MALGERNQCRLAKLPAPMKPTSVRRRSGVPTEVLGAARLQPARAGRVIDHDGERVALGRSERRTPVRLPRSGMCASRGRRRPRCRRRATSRTRPCSGARSSGRRRADSRARAPRTRRRSARAVRASEAELELLVVEPSPIEIEADVTDDDDRSTLACELGRERDRIVGVGAAAVTSTASHESWSAAPTSLLRRATSSAPACRAASTRHSSRSTPITSQPAARAILAVSWPTSPRPTTATRSPRRTSAWRKP